MRIYKIVDFAFLKKKCGTWKWKLYKLWWRRPPKQQHYWERPEYLEDSRRLEEICCHSNPSERPSANADVKNSNGDNNINNDKLFTP